jgi:hypothetical protein
LDELNWGKDPAADGYEVKRSADRADPRGSMRAVARPTNMNWGAEMYVMEVPIANGGHLLVQVDEGDLPGGPVPVARRRSDQVVAVAKQSVERALDQIKPSISVVTERLRAMAADEITVEFGLVLSAEGGAVVAKGSAEVHFAVSLVWKSGKEDSLPPPVGNDHTSGQTALDPDNSR